MHKCSIVGCPHEAKHEVIYELRSHVGETPATSTPIARVCDDHMYVNLWRKFWDNDNWKAICSAFVGMNRKPPSTVHSNCKLQPIGTAQKERLITKSINLN